MASYIPNFVLALDNAVNIRRGHGYIYIVRDRFVPATYSRHSDRDIRANSHCRYLGKLSARNGVKLKPTRVAQRQNPGLLNIIPFPAGGFLLLPTKSPPHLRQIVNRRITLR